MPCSVPVFGTDRNIPAVPAGTERNLKLCFVEAVGITAAAIAHASVAGSQGDPSNLQRFRAHHPPTFTGGGGPMVADHWFIQIEKVLEAMEITSDTTRIRPAVFQLESEAQIWWKWARTSRDLRGAFVGEFSPRD